MFGRRMGIGLGVLAVLLVGGCGGGGGEGARAPSTSSTPAPLGSVQIDHTLARTVTTFVASFRFTFFDEGGNAILGPTQTARVGTIRIGGVPVATRTMLIEYLSTTGVLIGQFQTPISVTEGGTTIVEDPAWTNVAPTAVTFAAPTTFSVGDNPFDLAVADFDGDGDSDFATANAGSNDVTVRLGNGQGSFGDPVSFAAGTTPLGIAAGYIDNDLQLDLVVGNGGSDNVSVLAGNGDGTFQPQVNFAVDGGPTHPALADFDGDGSVDIAVSTFLARNVQILVNDGTGQFTARPSVTTSPANRQRNVTAEDFDDDGDLDVAASSEVVPGRYSTLINVGNAFLGPASSITVGAFGLVSWIEAADLDGDAKVDLALGASGATLFARGNGNGTFATAVQVGSDSGQVAVGDVNGDGRPDLVGQTGTTVRILLGNGDGTFVESTVTAPAITSGVALADFNGDGRLDILAIQGNTDNAALFLQD